MNNLSPLRLRFEHAILQTLHLNKRHEAVKKTKTCRPHRAACVSKPKRLAARLIAIECSPVDHVFYLILTDAKIFSFAATERRSSGGVHLDTTSDRIILMESVQLLVSATSLFLLRLSFCSRLTTLAQIIISSVPFLFPFLFPFLLCAKDSLPGGVTGANSGPISTSSNKAKDTCRN